MIEIVKLGCSAYENKELCEGISVQFFCVTQNQWRRQAPFTGARVLLTRCAPVKSYVGVGTLFSVNICPTSYLCARPKPVAVWRQKDCIFYPLRETNNGARCRSPVSTSTNTAAGGHMSKCPSARHPILALY